MLEAALDELIKRFEAKEFTKKISKLNKIVPNVFEAVQCKLFEAGTNIGVKVLIKGNGETTSNRIGRGWI